ncbi:MAG: DinB family protein [Cytophagaceae bacterium]|nr:DinB family protein [Cytophagaceae bacterium]
MSRTFLSFGAGLLLLLSGFQSPQRATVAQLTADWERARVYTKEYLDAMPDDGYAFKPTPEIRSFAEVMYHLADANFGIAAAASGKASPMQGSMEKTATDKSKAAVTKAVLDSYDFVLDALKGMKDTQMGESVKVFGRFDLSREAALMKAFEHQTHHRGQTTVYLRLKGVKPPNEKLF